MKPGDQVTTDFYTASGLELGSVKGTRIVDRDGNIYFPYIGTVKVLGLDAEKIRALLVQRFQPFYTDPVVTVNVQLRVNITGVVGAPGHYFLDPTATIMDALANAGGIGSEVGVGGSGIAANSSAVRLVRDGKTIILNLRAEGADPTDVEMRIQSGDWIHVPPVALSRVRDNIAFITGVLALASSVLGTVLLITRK